MQALGVIEVHTHLRSIILYIVTNTEISYWEDIYIESSGNNLYYIIRNITLKINIHSI